ncbi:hypothetical protein EFA46_009145 [Halarchaeum sp. CBA1220]|uniref:hypothetical protein n=1 Tax=Halarchaeum sp. CBA1220 TaxID=1853682 RepID=UPI0011CD38BF|nr:hypothetical protein [Halarchaeum sp. CBA1220]QLC34365.1 hypothetical protein EFA46_009145 [Halarchaeum sp. CBA1220]
MADDIAGPVGPVDYPVLRQIRDLLLEEEPLVESTAFDDPVNPTELIVEFSSESDSPGRMEITWWKRGAYRYHYTESGGVDFRFDNHPKDGAPNAHFHPPPNAGPAEPSFLAGVTQPQIVTRAVITRWRRALIEGQGLESLNSDTDQ